MTINNVVNFQINNVVNFQIKDEFWKNEIKGLDDHAIQFKYLIDTKTKLFV